MIKVVVVAIMLLFLVDPAWSYWVETLPEPAPGRPRWQPFYVHKVKKCLADIPGLEACHPIILHSYRNRDVSKMKAKCCKAVRRLNKDCSKIVFGVYYDPFFRLTLIEHCSKHAAAPAPEG